MNSNAITVLTLLGAIERGQLSPGIIDAVLKNATNPNLCDLLRSADISALENILNAGKQDKEVAIKILNSDFVNSIEKIKQLSSQYQYIPVYTPQEILSLLLKYKDDQDFISQYLPQNSRFSLQSLAKEDINAFNKILATPELMKIFPVQDIAAIAEAHAKDNHYLSIPKNNAHLDPQVIAIINQSSVPQKKVIAIDASKPTTKQAINFIPNKIEASHIEFVLELNGKLLDDDEIIKAKALFEREENKNKNRINMISSRSKNYALLKIEDPYTKESRTCVIYKENKLGEGAFGKVKLMQDINSGEWLAVKIMDISEEHRKQSANLEIQNLQHLKQGQGYIIRQELNKEGVHKHQAIIAMKLAPGTVMAESSKKLPELTWIKRAANMLAAIDHVHQNGLIHRDIKLYNLMCNSANDVSLVDLGTAIKGPTAIAPAAGTPGYMAPEVVTACDLNRNVLFSDKTDAYSAAVALGEYLRFS